MTHAYRLVAIGSGEEAWYDDAVAATAAAAHRLSVPITTVDALKRRVTVDPVVVRRDGARWRSRSAWDYRSGGLTVRVFEMLHVDEALYDH